MVNTCADSWLKIGAVLCLFRDGRIVLLLVWEDGSVVVLYVLIVGLPDLLVGPYTDIVASRVSDSVNGSSEVTTREVSR